MEHQTAGRCCIIDRMLTGIVTCDVTHCIMDGVSALGFACSVARAGFMPACTTGRSEWEPESTAGAFSAGTDRHWQALRWPSRRFVVTLRDACRVTINATHPHRPWELNRWHTARHLLKTACTIQPTLHSKANKVVLTVHASQQKQKARTSAQQIHLERPASTERHPQKPGQPAGHHTETNRQCGSAA